MRPASFQTADFAGAPKTPDRESRAAERPSGGAAIAAPAPDCVRATMPDCVRPGADFCSSSTSRAAPLAPALCAGQLAGPSLSSCAPAATRLGRRTSGGPQSQPGPAADHSEFGARAAAGEDRASSPLAVRLTDSVTLVLQLALDASGLTADELIARGICLYAERIGMPTLVAMPISGIFDDDPAAGRKADWPSRLVACPSRVAAGAREERLGPAALPAHGAGGCEAAREAEYKDTS